MALNKESVAKKLMSAEARLYLMLARLETDISLSQNKDGAPTPDQLTSKQSLHFILDKIHSAKQAIVRS